MIFEKTNQQPRKEFTMKPSRTILEAIAREHLSIPTLETRKSDRLDFTTYPYGESKQP